MAMPFEVGGERERPALVEARPSAVQELAWLLSALTWFRETIAAGLEAAAPELRAELADVWPEEEAECAPLEMSILAERIGAYLIDEADTFLRGLARAAAMRGGGLELRSETPRIRATAVSRLERLRSEPELARRYTAVLTHVWDVARPDWERTGREFVRHTCDDWSHRLRQGARVTDFFPARHIARKPELEVLFQQRPRIVLTPMHFARMGGFLIDMTSFVHVGGPARLVEAEQLRRKESEVIATRMKVLADPTRVALLRELVHEPASVMDLARRFELAQPTVSNHVRLLRDAGLLEARKDGPKIVYSVPLEQIERLLDETRHLLLEH